jgi:hypothetical protein
VDYLLIGFVGGIVMALVAYGVWRLAKVGGGGKPVVPVKRETFVTSMRSVGELSVFRVMTKEVITASDHELGNFGRKYLKWLLAEKRITLVIELDVDFRYDLTDPRFQIEATGDDRFRLTLPPCRHEVLIRDLHIHSEDNTKLLPILVPDLIGRVFTSGFSVEAKNKLIADTRAQAVTYAGELVGKAMAEAQRSATESLTLLAQSFGARDVNFNFLPSDEFQAEVDASKLESLLPAPDQLRGGGF